MDGTDFDTYNGTSVEAFYSNGLFSKVYHALHVIWNSRLGVVWLHSSALDTSPLSEDCASALCRDTATSNTTIRKRFFIASPLTETDSHYFYISNKFHVIN
jgi:hypothetical protein